MSKNPEIIKSENELPIISSARSLLPRPLAIEQRGAPPIPKRFAKAITIVIIGKVTPTPVSAILEPSEILPIYILSITLYSILISCAKVIGTASLKILLETLPLEKSFHTFSPNI